METQKDPKSSGLIKKLTALAAVLTVVGAGCAAAEKTDVSTTPEPANDQTGETTLPPPVPPPAPTPTPSPKPTPTPTPKPSPSASSYKDGTYTAEGDYMTHVGPEAIHITITLKGDVIVDSQFQGTPNAAMSQGYMQMFADNYKPLVIGKNIDDVQLDRVSGSSLTPMGFNDALAKIKVQAKA